jgi:hypothetical protein
MQPLNFRNYRDWTPEEDAILTKMAEEGHSAREIGDVLNRKRNSIIGRRNRLKAGITFKGGNNPDRPKPLKGKVGRLASLPRVAPIVCTPIADGVGVKFIDAGPRSCMWFLEGQAGANGHVCGDMKVPGHSYCTAHLLAAYEAGSSSVRAAA